MAKKFAWGKQIDEFEYDFDGQKMVVIKYHPWKVKGSAILTGQVDYDSVLYHCAALHQSEESLFTLVLHFMARTTLGMNHGALVCGIARALKL
jgi:hypothetical protein